MVVTVTAIVLATLTNTFTYYPLGLFPEGVQTTTVQTI